AGVASGKARIALRRSRILDALLVEGLRQPLVAADFSHTDIDTELLGQFGESGVTLLQQLIPGTLGSGDVNTNATPAHLQHHRQQITFEPISGTGSLALEHRLETLEQHERADCVLFGIFADEA